MNQIEMELFELLKKIEFKENKQPMSITVTTTLSFPQRHQLHPKLLVFLSQLSMKKRKKEKNEINHINIIVDCFWCELIFECP